MGTSLRSGLWTVGAAVMVVAPAAAQQRPAEVTDSLIVVGEVLFHGSADCQGCHGPSGVGTAEGPKLSDRVWLHGDGSYAFIRRMVLHGLPRARSTTGVPMPIRGWEPLNDRQVDAVAAYVWHISHPPRE